MSSFLDKMKMAGETLKDTAKALANGDDVATSPEEEKRRNEICDACPKQSRAIPMAPRCEECGCFTKAVAKLATKKCPLGKF